MQNEKIADFEYHRSQGFSRRRLLDMYGDSLKYVNKLMNEAFGPAARKVIAHMPHMIDKNIMTKLQNKWPSQFDATSSHQLRDAHDMQYAFAYFYFLMQEKQDYNMSQIFQIYLDVDHDG